MAKLSKRTAEALDVRPSPYIVFDEQLPGFGVRVMPSGRRYFLVQYRRHGKTQRIMIGQFGPITAEIARTKARSLLGQARGGGDDAAASRNALRQSMTIQDLGKRFLKEHVAIRCKPSTQKEYKRSVVSRRRAATRGSCSSLKVTPEAREQPGARRFNVRLVHYSACSSETVRYPGLVSFDKRQGCVAEHRMAQNLGCQPKRSAQAIRTTSMKALSLAERSGAGCA
jgi:hypothetical protein